MNRVGTVVALIAGVAALYLARAVLVPIALAMLLTFMVHPIVSYLTRIGLGRAASVSVVVTMLFATLGGVCWILVIEFASLSTEIPGYRDNLIHKINEVRRLGRGGAVRLGGGLDMRQSRYGPNQTLDAGTLPAPRLRDRLLRGAHVSWSLYEDRFHTFRDLAGMTHSEDFNLGWEVGLELGRHLKSLGSDVDAHFFRATAAKGWAPGATSLVLFRAKGEGRHDSGDWQDASLNLALTAYHQGFRAQTQAVHVQVDAVHRPEPENDLYLGGMEGLRGYANHLLLGDRRWLASLEERLNTSYDWLGILRLGFVAYADGGAIRRADTGRWSRTYVDVGGGLRLGNLKSSTGRVFLLTVAYPLVRDPGTEHHQFVVTDVVTF